MNDDERDERILFLIKVWFYFVDTNVQWPKVKEFVERKLNEELE